MSFINGLGAAGLALGGVSSLANWWQQKQNLQWQQSLQHDIFSREDNSIRRRVKDLEAAGLSPVLAAGQGASAGQVIRTDPPQIQGNSLQDAMQLMQMQETISNTKAQRDLISAQTKSATAEAGIKNHDLKIFEKSGTTSNAGTLPNLFRNIEGISGSPIVQPLKEVLQNKTTQAELMKWFEEKLIPERIRNETKNRQADKREQEQLKNIRR